MAEDLVLLIYFYYNSFYLRVAEFNFVREFLIGVLLFLQALFCHIVFFFCSYSI